MALAVTKARSKRAGLVGLVVGAVVACVVFAPVVRYGFVYDDHWTIEGNAALSSALAPLLRALATGQAALRGIPDATRPTMVFSLWVDRHLFGPDPAGYHLHSLLLYAIATGAAGLAVFAVSRRRLAGIAGGLLFAVMPVHAEVVAAVNYREDLYAAIAVFSAVAWLFWPRERKESVDHAVLVAALVLVGLLAKESAVVVAPVVLVVAAARGRTHLRSWASRRRTSLVALGVVLALFSAWRAWLHARGRDDVPLVLAHRGAAERILRTLRYVVRGAVHGLVPVQWSPDYAPEPPASPLWLVPLAVLVAATVLLSRWRRGRVLAAGLGVALLGPLATSPLISPINEIADRYWLIGTLGGAIVWGELAARARRRVPSPLFRTVVVVVLLALSTVCRRAAASFRTDLGLWEVATERAPTSPRAWTGLARERRLLGDLDGADRAVARAIQLDSRFLRARVTRIYNLLARGDVARAHLEIEEIQRLGGARQLGLQHARMCVKLPPDAAARCVDPRPNQAASALGPGAE